MWRVVTNNLGWKLLSVALAVLLWIAVEGEPELVTVQAVPVFYRNVEPSLALVSNPPTAVRLELRGSSDVLGPDNLSNVAVRAGLGWRDRTGRESLPDFARQCDAAGGRDLRPFGSAPGSHCMWIEHRNLKGNSSPKQ